ncbi:Hypothetical predicted protein [Lecanosticta acicola]|uniref:ASST-domain-containing protein n=1 Tax=Lecanosticta acicola TaxID=111012 RepID=A0AAI9EDV4_9PEZI|nr:Hypothetical predicted protein [Lecanosticta acicola]
MAPTLKQYLALPLPLLATLIQAADPPPPPPPPPPDRNIDPGLFRFVSRPDIKAPRWNVQVHERSRVTPGYWFVAPFEILDQFEPGNGWIGPHIYDGDGELVWSGAPMVDNWGAIDFKLSNVRGEDMLTFLVHQHGDGYIVDETLEIQEKIDLGMLGEGFNSHEFNFIENGTRAIVISEQRRDATKDQAMAIQWEKNCRTLFNGFKELDTETWKPAHEWSSFGHVGLEESTFVDGGPGEFCYEMWGWDYVHFNSVDKDHNGDYYVSARHTDTIYKIAKSDGHVMWKLNGLQTRQKEEEERRKKELEEWKKKEEAEWKARVEEEKKKAAGGEKWMEKVGRDTKKDNKGEFDMGDLSFSRQHNVRFHGFNGTHEIISLLDNAHGQDAQGPSHTMSRGLVIALQTDVEPKTARIVSSIEHPDGRGSYAPRRGNYQVLPNDSVFIGWSEQATHSEHTPDGTLVMEATLVPEWLGTYRSYKFPFVGRPAEPPIAVSAAYRSHAVNSTTTMVHVSWNGATEVGSWNLYKTTETGEPMIQIFSRQRTGFETAMVWDGFASHVIVEAVDAEGEVVGRTDVVRTTSPPSEAVDGAVADEVYWLQELHEENDPWKYKDPYWLNHRAAGNSILGFLLGALCVGGLVALLWRFRNRGFGLFRARRSKSSSNNPQRYEPLDDQERGGDVSSAVSSEEQYVKRSSPGFFRDREE